MRLQCFFLFCIVLVSLVCAVRLPLQTRSRWIVDQNDERVRLACVNWYGAHMENFVVNGLWAQPLSNISHAIVAMGFNCVRLPFSTELYISNPLVTNSSVLAANKHLLGLSALEVLDAVVNSLSESGLMIILNNHIGKAGWCCSETDGEGLWYSSSFTEAQFVEAWVGLASRFKTIPHVIGADLRNELRVGVDHLAPTWGSGIQETDWAAAATRCGEAVLAVNKDLLIIVEGPSYSTDLSCVASHPLSLSVPNRLVYSPHDYSWSQSARTYDEYKRKMDKQWGYLVAADQAFTAPVWLGEFGTDVSDSWWGWILRYAGELDLDWCYWALDGEQNIGIDESFGIFMPDYRTIRHPWKLADLQTIQSK